MKTLVLYDSLGGNTQKVAERIHKVAQSKGLNATLIKLEPNTKIEFYDYDLVFMGTPTVEWLPTPKMMNFVKEKMQEHRLRGDILPATPIKPNKIAVPFTTFCGAHIGDEEAISVTQWIAAFFGHIGYKIVDSIHIVGEMRNFGQAKGWMNDKILDTLNTRGKFGNIKGRPSEQDLLELEKRIIKIINNCAI